MTSLALVAGEASGDLLGGLLLKGLQARWPALRAHGIGGPQMAEQGFEAWWPSERLAVRGYVEVLRHYRAIKGIRDALRERLLAHPPAAFVGIDAPDFNLGLEAALKARGLRTVHFVCPSIWAWRGGRAEKLAASADHVLCLFPFEPALLHRHGVAASYVGHPLADVIPMRPPREAARERLGLHPQDAVVAVLPGSRRSEIEYIAPGFLRAVQLLHRQRRDLRFVLPAAPGLHEMLQAMLRSLAPEVPLQLLAGQSHAAMAACDVGLVASGTATLEMALFKRPMVIGYRMHPLSWAMMKRMRYQPWAGLPNILCEDFVVPERIQEACEPAQLAVDVLRALDDAAMVQRVEARFGDLHAQLRCNTAQRAADAMEAVIGAPR
jgi:lipid-A-disaccharide synthase